MKKNNYNLNTKVFFMSNNEIVCGKIKKVAQLISDQEEVREMYVVSCSYPFENMGGIFPPSKLFLNVEDLVKDLSEQFIKKVEEECLPF